MTTLFVSGADERYGLHLLNLVGSVKANSDIFDGIVVYDLGLSARQSRLIRSIRGVEVRTVPAFVPHWAQGRTWKTWIWTHLEADRMFWLDAGATVLRSLAGPLEQVDELGYFVVGQGHPMRPMIPSDYFELYGIDEDLPEREAVAAGILAFDTRSAFFDRVIVPTHEDALLGRNLGFSAGEVEKLNRGLDRLDPPIVRDCPLFRYDQTIFGIRFYQGVQDPVVSDLRKYGGWETSHDHPDQLIWSHRRRGDYRYLWRVPYVWRAAPAGWAFTARFRAAWWRTQHGWKLTPGTYVAKIKRLLART
jgi:hypothetical protein